MDATSLIQFKRATAANITSYTAAPGEPFFDITNDRLYIGDGISTPGKLLNTSDTLTTHLIASRTTGIGPYHTIECEVGEVIIGSGTNSVEVRSLTFDDLDENGKHAMANHTGAAHSIWYSQEIVSGTGYQVKPLGYSFAAGGRSGNGLDTTTGLGAGESKTFALTVRWVDATGENYIDFREIGFGDLTGTISDSVLITDFKSADGWRMLYTDANGTVKSDITFGASGTVLLGKGASTKPEFGRILLGDATGATIFGATSRGGVGGGNLHSTLVSNGTSWVETSRIQSDVTGNFANLILNLTSSAEQVLLKIGRNATNIYSLIGRFNLSGRNPRLNNRLTFISNTADTTGADIDFWCSENRSETTGYGSNMSDITGVSDYYPDIRFDTYGNVQLKTQLYTSTAIGSNLAEGGKYFTPFYCGDRTSIINSNNFVSGYYGVRIGNLSIVKSYTSDITGVKDSFAALYCQSIDSTATDQTTAMPTTAFLLCGDIRSTHSNVYGMKIGKLNSGKSVYGIYLNDLTSSATTTGFCTVGISITNLPTADLDVRKSAIYISTEDEQPEDNIPPTGTDYAIYVKSGHVQFEDDLQVGGYVDGKLNVADATIKVIGDKYIFAYGASTVDPGDYGFIYVDTTGVLSNNLFPPGTDRKAFTIYNKGSHNITLNEGGDANEDKWKILLNSDAASFVLKPKCCVTFIGDNDENAWRMISYNRD